MPNFMQIHHSEEAPQAIGPYSQAISSQGFLFLSGQIPLDPTSGHLIEGDITAQTEQVLKNMEAILKSSGSGLNKVIKTTIFLKNLAHFQTVNEVYGLFFGDHKPARSTIEVSNLPKGAEIEIECIAIRAEES